MRFRPKFLFFGMFWFISSSPLMAYKVVVSIPPLASLTRAVAGDRIEIQTLVDQAVSPHVYALKPSDIQKISNADLIFWIGISYESFLDKALKNYTSQAIALIDTPSLTLYPLRTSECDHQGCHHDLDPLQRDGHIWLDPDNGIILAQEIMNQLVRLDPESQEFYQKRFQDLKQRLELLKLEIGKILHPHQKRGFLVFHDGYQYFEKAFNLKNGQVMSLVPDVNPSIKRLSKLRHLIQQNQIQCLFSETQFSPRLMQTLAQETGLKIGTLDPLGNAGASYEDLLRNLAYAFDRTMRDTP